MCSYAKTSPTVGTGKSNIPEVTPISNILIRRISILSAYLGSKIHIDYKYKMSDWEGLSKKNRHIQNEDESCKKMEKLKIAPAFLDWMKSPHPDWSLPKKLAIWLE